jgi:hypothetical protein
MDLRRRPTERLHLGKFDPASERPEWVNST